MRPYGYLITQAAPEAHVPVQLALLELAFFQLWEVASISTVSRESILQAKGACPQAADD